jgi:23S rRNA (uracil1939-C5)-methyltransferase
VPGALLELDIDALAAGGDGVGRGPDGRVVFVPFTAPGDRVRVRLVEERARFARGELESLVEPGPGRVEPPCPVFGRCGGCAWQHLSVEAQLAARRDILRDALERVGRLGPLPDIDFVPSPAAYGYRGRARIRVEGGSVGFRRRRSHALCAVAGCPLLAPPLDAALARLVADPPAGSGEWELVMGVDGTVRQSALPPPAGAPAVELEVAAQRLRVSPGVFVQANALLLDRLVSEVVEAAGSGDAFLELHAGAGTFTLGLARRFAGGVAIESSRAAASDLRHNLGAAGADHVRVVRAEASLRRLRGVLRDLRPDAVVLDPPRAGVGREVAGALARLAARRIVHLACDPATLARDLAVFRAGGWLVTRVTGFDLFPQTPHVEALAVLEREPRA